MDPTRQVDRIIRQLSEVAGASRPRLAGGSDGVLVSEAVQSLRLTLAVLVQPGPLRPVGEHELRGVAPRAGGLDVWEGDRVLPIDEGPQRRLLEESGLALDAGEFLLLGHALGTRIIEDALKATSREERDVRERKIRLLAASLGPEGIARGRPQGRPDRPPLRSRGTSGLRPEV